jgi:hypothetical protein
MANHSCIAATGKSIERLLGAWLRANPPLTTGPTKASLVHTDAFADVAGSITPPTVSVYLYRIHPNAVMRAAWGAQGSIDGRGHLPLDLHFLITAWASDAGDELTLLGKALECLESTPLLAGPLLFPSGGWAAGDVIQLIPDDVGVDTLLSLFDSLETPFRLSAPYVARIARIDGLRPTPPVDVTTVVAGAHP